MVMSELLANIQQRLDADDYLGGMELAEAALGDEATRADAFYAIAAIACRTGDLAGALKILEDLAQAPTVSGETIEALAVVNCLVGRISEALYNGKVSAAMGVTGVPPLFGPHFPTFADAFMTISARPLFRRAMNAFCTGSSDALMLVEQHLSVFPQDVEALDLYSSILVEADRVDEAIGVLRSVLTMAGPSATLLSRLGACLTEIGDHSAAIACHDLALQRAPNSFPLWSACLKDWRYHPLNDSAQHTSLVEQWRALVESKAPKVRRAPPPMTKTGRLSVGFIMAANLDQDAKLMIARLATSLDRSRVTVCGFGRGDLTNVDNLVFRSSFDRWRDIGALDELTTAAVIRGEGVDIAIDCDGILGATHPGLFLRNCAPIQLAWLNTSSSVPVVGSQGSLSDMLTAGPLLLNPREAVRATSPALTAGAITFAADVKLSELNSEVAMAWGSILQQVPDSMLILREPGEQFKGDAVSKLLTLFGNFGVAHRIDVVTGGVGEFFAQADIALAPFPMNRPAVYGTALASGLPVITLAGDDLAATIAACGHADQMVCASVDAYVNCAVSWSQDLEKLAARRENMPAELEASATFDAAKFGQSLLDVVLPLYSPKADAALS